MLDMAAAVTPIGLFFGRIANFINGEFWGRPAPDFPYAVVFPHAGPVPRHPSQLYEAFGEGLCSSSSWPSRCACFGFRRPGLLGGIFVLGYAIARIVCEFFREPDEQLGFLFGSSVQALSGGITMGMLLSLPMALLGTAVIVGCLRGCTQPRPVRRREPALRDTFGSMIALDGPMTVERYMEPVPPALLRHPRSARRGTATSPPRPEISQMFGELIGAMDDRDLARHGPARPRPTSSSSDRGAAR